ncbi:MAG: hypothetical protein OEL89_01280 [Candidatus Peregrinibacteria bacterium]|nr:hypothetical protein [Candidatus Peregrinibacteria bacterium]
MKKTVHLNEEIHEEMRKRAFEKKSSIQAETNELLKKALRQED